MIYYPLAEAPRKWSSFRNGEIRLTAIVDTPPQITTLQPNWFARFCSKAITEKHPFLLRKNDMSWRLVDYAKMFQYITVQEVLLKGAFCLRTLRWKNEAETLKSFSVWNTQGSNNGDFEGIPFNIKVHCLGWWYTDPWYVEIFGQIVFLHQLFKKVCLPLFERKIYDWWAKVGEDRVALAVVDGDRCVNPPFQRQRWNQVMENDQKVTLF